MNKIIGFLIIIIFGLIALTYMKDQKKDPVLAQNNINTGNGIINGSGEPVNDILDSIVVVNQIKNKGKSDMQTSSFKYQIPLEVPYVIQENGQNMDSDKNTKEIRLLTNKNVDEGALEKTAPENNTQDEEIIITEENIIDTESVSQHNKALYMWSSAFSENSSDTIIDFIEGQDFNTVIISMNQAHTARINKMSVINTLRDRGVSIEAMLSKNSIIDASDDDIRTYVESVFSGSFNFSAIDRIHLDIEPHVMDDWHDNKTAYLDKYMNMLGIIKDYADSKGVGVSVSIPLHYPIEYTNQIFDMVDMVYFMAYENVSISHISRKTGEYLPTYRSKVNLALRTNDFNNSTEIHDLADTLLSNMNLNDYTIHDFQSLKAFIGGE